MASLILRQLARSEAVMFCTLAGLLCGCATRPTAEPSFPPEAALPIQSGWPDPLAMFDGRPVTSKAQWNKERRPELRELFQHYMYGSILRSQRRCMPALLANMRIFLRVRPR